MKTPRPNATDHRSHCPVASALDLVGDSWTMLIIRDLLLGASRFNDFLASPEGITTNILTSRLRMMEAQGLICKEAYQSNPRRYAYRMTDKGKALTPVMRALMKWGMQWIPGRSVKEAVVRKRSGCSG
jgi:DNA-binding HxlR family transcriptional regulator